MLNQVRSACLALALLLVACQAQAPSNKGVPPRPTSLGGKSSPIPSSLPLAGSASPGVQAQVKAPPLGIPARVNMALPATLVGPSITLLGNDGAALLANDGGSLIANDGAALIANDGSSLIANDGSGLIANDGSGIISNDGGGLIANDGAGVVAGGAGNYRVQQEDLDISTQAALTLSASRTTPKAAASTNLMLYGWQVISVNTLLKALGAKRWVSGQPQAVMTSFRMLNGGDETMMANVVPLPGRPGPDGKPIPTFVCYEVRELVKQHVVGGQPKAQRPEEPFLILEVLGEGKGRVVWRQKIVYHDGMRVVFATSFDLKKKQILAEAALSHGSQELRHLRWAFDQVDGQLRVQAQVRTDGPTCPPDQILRRLAFQMHPDGTAAFSVQCAALDGPFSWLLDPQGSMGEQPTFFSLGPDGELLPERPSHGPRADDGPSRAFAFEGLGALPLKIPGRAEQEAANQASFAFPTGWTAPMWTVLSSPEMDKKLLGDRPASPSALP